MITDVLIAKKVGNVFHYNKREYKLDLEEIPTKSDEFAIVRKFNTKEVTRWISNMPHTRLQKIKPFVEEKVYCDGKLIEFDFWKKGINIYTKTFSNGCGFGENGLYKKYSDLSERLKEQYDEKEFENYNLIVVEYLASSGSDFVLEPIAMFNDDQLNINIPIKKAEIGTCDMRSHQICILITKDIFELKDCDNYLVRFIEE